MTPLAGRSALHLWLSNVFPFGLSLTRLCRMREHNPGPARAHSRYHCAMRLSFSSRFPLSPHSHKTHHSSFQRASQPLRYAV
ncbi:hypothetical protein BDU57DRAFT_509589, partial [Ampelomyces quisqualis]